ncbi:MAG: LptF/LptG family permease [Candidatus Sulfobium sp.]
MLKVIYRSILRELLVTFLLTLAFLNSVLMMEKMLRLSRLLSGVGASFFDMLKIILLLQPQLMLLTVPMSLLLSTLLVYGRMNHDSETIILRASGMDFRKISFPVAILGVLCFLLSVATSFYLSPKGSGGLREEVKTIIAVGSTHAIEEGTFNSSFRNIVILVKGKTPPDRLDDIFIYDSRRKDEPRVLMAREGRLFMQNGMTIGIDLKNGYMNIIKETTTTELFFKRYRFSLNLDYDASSPRNKEFTPLQLLKKIRTTGDGKERKSLYLEFNRRLSLPVVCLLLILLGPPLSLLSGKSGRLGGLAIGLLVFTVYYVLLAYCENLVLASRIPYYVGAWVPTVLLGAFAVIMFRKESLR